MTEKERMLAGELYKDSDPELVAERRRAQGLVDRFNGTTSEQTAERHQLLTELQGAGPFTVLAPTDTAFLSLPDVPEDAPPEAVLDAILTGDAEAARKAMMAHLGFVHTTIKQFDEDQARQARITRLPGDPDPTREKNA